MLVQVDEVVGLEEHVAELGVAQPAVGPFQAALDRVLGEHHVDGEVLADVAEELQVAEAAHPVVVVHQQGRMGAAVEVEKPLKLPLDRRHVRLEDLQGKQLALLALTARVADHPGRPAHQGDRPMPGLLKSPQDHQGHEVPHVETVGRRIEAGIDRPRPLHEPRGQVLVVGRLIDQPAPAEFGEQVVHEQGSGPGARD